MLRDHSVIVPQDAAVFELIASWGKAPTASAEIVVPPNLALFEPVDRQTTPSTTTPVGCH